MRLLIDTNGVQFRMADSVGSDGEPESVRIAPDVGKGRAGN